LKSWKPNSFSTNAASRALLAAVAFLLIGCSHQAMQTQTPIKVEIVRSGAGYQLLRGGQPYTVKGAGMMRDDIASLVAHGGNSIRNWSTDDKRYDIRGLLDSAYAHGATVVLCLPMKAERHGFDYNDEAAVAEQFRALRKDVLKYRDHPALLAWIIGNELNHSYSNPRVFDAVNDVARMIHELDPNHPVTTAMSGFHPEVIAEALKRAPALDFLSFQNYGSLFSLPKWIMETGLARPFMVTEWGDGKDPVGCTSRADQQRKGRRHPSRVARGAGAPRGSAHWLLRVQVGLEAGAHAHLVRATARQRRGDRVRGRHALHLERCVAEEPVSPREVTAARRQRCPRGRDPGYRRELRGQS
jgi:hypothetical protein